MASIRQLHWDADRVKEKSSLDVILEWVTAGDNYARWRDVNIPNKSLCDEIQALLQEEGIMHRNEQDIRNKIQAFEKSIKQAKRSIIRKGLDENVTALEMLHNDSLEQKILKECPIFNTLATVMVHHVQMETRSSAKRQRRDNGEDPASVASTSQPIEGEEEGENDARAEQDESLDENRNDESYLASDDDIERETSALKLQDIREQFELKREMREIELHEVRIRSEMELVVKRTMCRQRLLKAGIAEAEVENVLPRKRLASETEF